MQIIVPAKLFISQYRFFRPVPQVLKNSSIPTRSLFKLIQTNEIHGTHPK